VASQVQTYRGNGPFDPNFTGTGSQPLNYDDFSARYNRYKVVASSIVVRCMLPSTQVGAKIAVYPSNTSTALSTPEAMSLPRAKFRYIQGGNTDFVFKQSCRSSAIDGSYPGQFLGRETVDAQVTTVPTDQWYWHIVQSSYDDSTSVKVYYEVLVIYDVVFYDRTDPRLDLLSKLVELRASRKTFLQAKAGVERKVKDDQKTTQESKQTAATAAKVDDEFEMIDLSGRSVKLRRCFAGGEKG
jgi:hypothetical protein